MYLKQLERLWTLRSQKFGLTQWKRRLKLFDREWNFNSAPLPRGKQAVEVAGYMQWKRAQMDLRLVKAVMLQRGMVKWKGLTMKRHFHRHPTGPLSKHWCRWLYKKILPYTKWMWRLLTMAAYPHAISANSARDPPTKLLPFCVSHLRCRPLKKVFRQSVTQVRPFPNRPWVYVYVYMLMIIW